MYTVTLEEFESAGWLHLINEGVFNITRNNIYKLDGKTWKPLCSFEIESEERYRAYFCEKFWDFHKTKQGNTYNCINIAKGEEGRYQLLNCAVLSGALLFDRESTQYIGAGRYNDISGLLLGDLQKSKPTKFIEGNFFSGIIQHGEHFIIRSRGENPKLICFDKRLNTVWETPLAYSGAAMRGLPCNPEIYQDIVYVNMPEFAFYQKNPTPMDIGAFCAKTGRNLWSETLPCCARNADLHGGEVYLASDKFLQIRNVSTGEVVWEMLPFWSEDDAPCLLYPLNKQDLLVNFQFKNIVLVINRADNIIKQTITLPERSHYCLSPATFPTQISEKRWMCEADYTDFTQNARNSGVVTIDLDNNQAEKTEATIKPRPKHKLRGKTVENGEKEYFLELNHSDLDEVIRYGIIIIQNFGHDKGTHSPPIKTDRKHNGKIHVSVVKSSLVTDKVDDEIINDLMAIKTIAENTLKSFGLRAGNGKCDFNIDIQLT